MRPLKSTLGIVGDEEPANLSPIRPAENSSGWAINWLGLVVVLLIAVAVLVISGWLGSSNTSDPSEQLSATGTTAPVEETPRSTTPEPSAIPTSAAPTTISSSTTSTVAPGKRVIISGEMKPCRFGANCLVASFTIEGFDEHPGRFVCIYPNSRSDFSFNDGDVDDACVTADAGDTIIIEVDGVRSSTISEQNLEGT